MSLWSVVCLLAIQSVAAEWNYYDAFSGEVMSEDGYWLSVADNTTFWCVNYIQDCDASEPRRLDGSCNNLKYPQRGASHTPSYRLLPAVYSDGYEPRLSAAGESLPLPRKIRTSLLAEGRVPDQYVTNLVSHIMLMITMDTTSVHDSINYMFWRDCCDDDTSDDEGCIPLEIPEDDPVHRFSGHRCQNLTRPLSFQSEGCVADNTEPNRINSALPLFDLNPIYGENLTKSDAGRLHERGLMLYDVLEDGSIWPPTVESPNICNANKAELNETRCHNVPGGFNTLIGGNIAGIWFYRNHYHIANALADLNTCWDDDRLFYTARDINIAMYNEFTYKELFGTLIGYDNLVAAGVVSEEDTFRDLYDDSYIPEMSVEFMSALRWIHTIMDANLELTQADGTVIGEIPAVNLTFRTGYLAVDNHLEYLTHGSYRQAGAKLDNIVDPFLAGIGLANHNVITDIFAADLAKNRYFGFAPYVDYLGYCVGKNISTWEDLEEYFAPENLENLKNIYEDVTDIEPMAGMWLENIIEGGYSPITFACIMNERLLRNIKSDRHWYERADRPHAFTEEQLRQIRNANVADFLCTNGDNVTQIQPNPFVRIGEGNELQSCETLPKVDLSAWADATCNA